jgi:hypothetical protein
MIKHAKVSGKADGTDPTNIQPSDWNNDHVITGDITLPGNLIVGSGNLGIGMTPVNILDITQNQNARSRIALLNNNVGASSETSFVLLNGTNGFEMGYFGTGFSPSGMNRTDGGFLACSGAGGMSIFTQATQPIYFGINSSESARMDAAGLKVGATANISGMDNSGGQILAGRGFYTSGTNGLAWDSTTYIHGTGSASISVLVNSGGVTLASGASAWAATSDYRAKTVFGAYTDSGAIIDAVPVYSAAMKTAPGSVEAMFIAHEVQAAVPYAVHGAKDAVDESGAPVFQMVETTDPLVPIMWAEIRALRQRIAALEAKP